MSIRIEKFVEGNHDDALTKIGGFILLLNILSSIHFISSFWIEEYRGLTIPWIIAFVIGVTLAGRGVRRDGRDYRQGDLRFKEHRFAAFIGGDVDFIDWQKRKPETYAIAVDLQRRAFFLFINGLMAHIPVDQIREVGWGVYEKGNLIVSDLSMIGHKWAFDSAEKQREWDKSGLLFRLKSVDHPELRVKMGSEKTIRKWMEIWNQMAKGAPTSTKKVPVAPAEAI